MCMCRLCVYCEVSLFLLSDIGGWLCWLFSILFCILLILLFVWF